MIKRNSKPRISKERQKIKQRIDSPEESGAQPDSAGETRHENRELVKKLKEKLEAGRTTERTPIGVPMVEEPMFQMKPVEKGTPIPSFRTPRIISQEALIEFSLAAVGIERISPLINNNQDSLTKPS